MTNTAMLDNDKKLLKTVFITTFDLDEKDFSENLKIGDIPAWDSVGQLNLIFALENAFNIKFEMEQIPEMNSIDKIILAILKLKQ